MVTGDDFTIHDIAIEDTPGDALKVVGADGVTIRPRPRRVDRRPADDGQRRVRPLSGAVQERADRGLGRDRRVRRRHLRRPVGEHHRPRQPRRAERRRHRDRELDRRRRLRQHRDRQHRRHPGVQPAGPRRSRTARGTRVFDNEIFDNNTRTSRRAGNIVGRCRPAPASSLLAAHEVEIFDNTIRDHIAVNIGMISYVPIDASAERPRLRPVPDRDLHPRQHDHRHERTCRPASSARC